MGRRLLFLFLLTLIVIAGIQLTAGIREQRNEARYPPEGKLIKLGTVDVHAEVRGEGPDLVLLHGASGNLRDFTFSLMDRLAEDYRVIALDRPGLGWTEQPKGYGGPWNIAGESPQVQADLLKRAADELGVERPLVLGHSFAGTVAMAWAQQNPDTAGLILVSAVSHPWPGDLHWQYPLLASYPGGAVVAALVSAYTPQSVIDNALTDVFAPQSVPSGYKAHIGPGLTIRRVSQRANARQVNNLRPHVVEMSESYPELTLPIEIVHGDADTIVPMTVHAEPMAARVQSANLTILEGVGHMPHHSHADDVIAAIHRAATRAGLR